MTVGFAFDREIRRTSLGESVYLTLLEAICRGKLPRGTVLSAVQVSRQLRVSRTPVVEALRRLTSDGLLVAEPGRKARVAEFTPREIVEVYQMRQLLEGAAAELAALNLTDTQLAGLAEVADSLAEPTVDWIERALAFDCQLHDTIASASGRQRLAQDIARYRLLVRGLCRMSGSERNLRDALAEHQAIVDALAHRDPQGAKAAMEHHIACRQAAVLAEMTEDVTAR